MCKKWNMRAYCSANRNTELTRSLTVQTADLQLYDRLALCAIAVDSALPLIDAVWIRHCALSLVKSTGSQGRLLVSVYLSVHWVTPKNRRRHRRKMFAPPPAEFSTARRRASRILLQPPKKGRSLVQMQSTVSILHYLFDKLFTVKLNCNWPCCGR